MKTIKIIKPERRVMTRQIARNIMKREIKSNKIQNPWLNMQIKRFEFIPWFKMRVACDPRKRKSATLSLLYAKS
jgi:hypothetical protein